MVYLAKSLVDDAEDFNRFSNLAMEERLSFEDSKDVLSTNRKIDSSLTPLLANRPTIKDPFTLEMGFMISLSTIANKCRCPVTRREAMDLLPRIHPQREVMWDAKWLHKICEYVINYEEADCPARVTEDPATWPTEENRIVIAYAIPDYEGLIHKPQPVTFAKRKDGELVTWIEHLS